MILLVLTISLSSEFFALVIRYGAVHTQSVCVLGPTLHTHTAHCYRFERAAPHSIVCLCVSTYALCMCVRDRDESGKASWRAYNVQYTAKDERGKLRRYTHGETKVSIKKKLQRKSKRWIKCDIKLCVALCCSGWKRTEKRRQKSERNTNANEAGAAATAVWRATARQRQIHCTNDMNAEQHKAIRCHCNFSRYQNSRRAFFSIFNFSFHFLVEKIQTFRMRAHKHTVTSNACKAFPFKHSLSLNQWQNTGSDFVNEKKWENAMWFLSFISCELNTRFNYPFFVSNIYQF